MFKSFRAAALTVCALAAFAAAPAAAQTISQQTRTTNAGLNDNQPRFAQIVTAPNGRLTTFSVELDGFGQGGTVVPQVFAFSGDSLTGPALFTGTAFPLAAGSNTYTFTTGGVPVTVGSRYALVFTATGEAGGIAYASNNPLSGSELRTANSAMATTLNELGGFNCGTGCDAKFSVTFEAAPTPVPTLSEWAMIILGLMLAGGAALTLQRRQSVRVRV